MNSAAAPSIAPRTSPLELRWQWSRLEALSATDLYAVIVARQQVFTIEQHCLFQDADGHDPFAWHLLGWAARPDASLVAYLRVVDAERKFAEPSIGRVLTLPPHRRVGLGRLLMQEGIARTRGQWPGMPIRIAAQQRLEAFYLSLGFRTVSPPYEEDGIPHVDMLLNG